MLKDWFSKKPGDDWFTYLLRIGVGAFVLVAAAMFIALMFYGGLLGLGYAAPLLCNDEVYDCAKVRNIPLALADLVFMPIGIFIVARTIYRWLADQFDFLPPWLNVLTCPQCGWVAESPTREQYCNCATATRGDWLPPYVPMTPVRRFRPWSEDRQRYKYMGYPLFFGVKREHDEPGA